MDLNDRIKEFYDQSTPLWLDIWGEHMHHGFYGRDGNVSKDRTQAQVDMIEEILRWSGTIEAKNILDAGCGVGGSARYLASKFNAQVLGLTLSPVQVEAGMQLNENANLSHLVTLECRDMLELKNGKGSYDLIWSMESAEHIKDKKGLFKLFYDLLSPGGTLVMATWCHRKIPPVIGREEAQLLNKVYKLYHLPPMVAIDDLAIFAKSCGYENIQTDDWSTAVAPFWGKVIGTALSKQGILGLLNAGLKTIQGAWAMRYMQKGFRKGLIRFGVLTAQKSK